MPPLTVEATQLSYDLAVRGGACSEAVTQAGRELTAAQQATESLDERAFRLGLAAADLDAESDRHNAAAEDAAGHATFRFNKWGQDDETARSLQREAEACRRLVVKCMEEAVRLRSQAAALQRTQQYRDDYIAIVTDAAPGVARVLEGVGR